MHAEAKKTEAMLREVARRTREAEQAQNGTLISCFLLRLLVNNSEF